MRDGMEDYERIAAYMAQNGTARLTPAQRRRVRKKTNHVTAGNIPQGRLRKRHERSLMREMKRRARDVTEQLRAARQVGGIRKLVALQAASKDEAS